MAYWIIKANSNYYDHLGSFKKNGYIDWKQNKFVVNEGDVVYVFFSKPDDRIRVKGKIEKVNMQPNEVTDDFEFWKQKKKYYTGKKGVYMRIRMVDEVDTSELSLHKLVANGMTPSLSAMYKLDNLYLIEYIDKRFKNKEEEIFDVESGRNIPQHVRNIVYKRDGGACVECGSTHKIHFDHILPYSKGGTSDNPENIRILCEKCNLKKGDKI